MLYLKWFEVVVEIVVEVVVVVVVGEVVVEVVVVVCEVVAEVVVVVVVVVVVDVVLEVVCGLALLGSLVLDPSTCSKHCSPAWHLAPSKCVPGAHDMCLATQPGVPKVPMVPIVPSVPSKLLVPNVRWHE